MKILRFTRRTIMAGLLVAMLALNVATIAFSSVALLLSTAYEAVTGAASVTSTLREEVNVKNKRISDLEIDVGGRDQRIASMNADFDRDLQVRNGRITELEVDIDAKNSRIASLTDELADSRASRMVNYRGQRTLVSDAVEHTTERVGRRLTVSTSRSVGSVFAESIPFFGIAVIVGATTWEIADACDTMDDLHQLDVAFNPDNAVPDDHSEVCGLTVPTKEEIWQFVKDSPGAAWQLAKDLMPELPEFEMPEVELSWPWEWF